MSGHSRSAGAEGRDIYVPEPWAFDGDLDRHAEVVDPNWHPARVVRRVRYRKCLKCRQVHWTEDVIKIRICDLCKKAQEGLMYFQPAELARRRKSPRKPKVRINFGRNL